MNSLVTQKEVDRAVVGFESGFIWGLQSLNARANRLQGYNHFLGQPNAITMDLDRYRNAKLADLQSMAKKYLVPERRVEILTMPSAKAAPTKAAPTK